jgi:tRNA 2-selenouridine synthase
LPQTLHIQAFINQCAGFTNIIDVRSPKEFLQGHIPGANNIPLFNNEERALVGTLYKKSGRQEAIIKGLEIVGPKMAEIVTKAQSIAINNTVYLHCWRGGMRSGSVAWLLKMYGLNVYTLKGGYKAFRNFVLQSFNNQLSILILGGKTGSAKTLILEKLHQQHQQVINLEHLANHKGSAFGALGQNQQPSQEQFENELAIKTLNVNPNLPLWLEDESRLIGQKIIPNGLWEQMLKAKVIYVSLPFSERVKYLVKEYGQFPKEQLEKSILKISKRLGSEQTKKCIDALNENDLNTTCEICLNYYDKTYNYGLLKREKEKVEEIHFEEINFDLILETLIQKAKAIN